jgi:hypothetical protein
MIAAATKGNGKVSDNRDPNIYETEITDEDGLAWAVRHTIGVGEESPGLPITSRVEFVRETDRFAGRVEGVEPATADDYRAALADAKRLEIKGGSGF